MIIHYVKPWYDGIPNIYSLYYNLLVPRREKVAEAIISATYINDLLHIIIWIYEVVGNSTISYARTRGNLLGNYCKAFSVPVQDLYQRYRF